MNDNLPNIGNKKWNGMIQVFAYEVNNNIDSISLILVMGQKEQIDHFVFPQKALWR